MEIPDCFYRVSVKALILNETKDKFLIVKDEHGLWEFPGGGLDWGMPVPAELAREIKEEMNLDVAAIADRPCYFAVAESEPGKGVWIANVLYETTLEHLNFTPSDECVELRFVDQTDLAELNVFDIVRQVAEQFGPENH